MGVTAENLAREYGIRPRIAGCPRALHSQHKARMAIDAGRFKDEIVPVVTQRNGQSLVVDTDEQPHRCQRRGLARLILPLTGSVR